MADIDYSNIDEKCIPMVEYFNSVGLTTKFSCQGHDKEYKNSFEIIFADNIQDEDISLYIERYSNIYNHTPFCGKFTKWIRKISGKIVSNWMYSINYGNCELNQKMAHIDLCKMKQEIK